MNQLMTSSILKIALYFWLLGTVYATTNGVIVKVGENDPGSCPTEGDHVFYAQNKISGSSGLTW